MSNEDDSSADALNVKRDLAEQEAEKRRKSHAIMALRSAGAYVVYVEGTAGTDTVLVAEPGGWKDIGRDGQEAIIKQFGADTMLQGLYPNPNAGKAPLGIIIAHTSTNAVERYCHEMGIPIHNTLDAPITRQKLLEYVKNGRPFELGNDPSFEVSR